MSSWRPITQESLFRIQVAAQAYFAYKALQEQWTIWEIRSLDLKDLEDEIEVAYLWGTSSRLEEATLRIPVTELMKYDEAQQILAPMIIGAPPLETGRPRQQEAVITEAKNEKRVDKLTVGLLFRKGSFWVGVHWSANNRRFCINFVPCITIWVCLPGGFKP